jgi:ribonuclease Z
MDLDVVFLGTGGSIPSARRNTASVLVRRGGDRLLFDCGEGTQRQMQRSTGLIGVDAIFITHLHADHYLGLPGLIKSYEMQDRTEPLEIYGPPGLIALFESMARIVGRPRYPVQLAEVNRGERIERDGYVVEPFDVSHRIVANGYALYEHPRPGRFEPDVARRLGVEPGPAFGRLQRGEAVEVDGATVAPEQVMGTGRPGRKIVITGDTEPCEETRIAAHGAELLIHDASFTAAEADRAAETRHSTAAGAAAVAADAEVRMLALVHISSRHFVPDVLEEARAIFPAAIAPRDFDLVEIPFPERGDPELVEGGARHDSRPGATPTGSDAGPV